MISYSVVKNYVAVTIATIDHTKCKTVNEVGISNSFIRAVASGHHLRYFGIITLLAPRFVSGSSNTACYIQHGTKVPKKLPCSTVQCELYSTLQNISSQKQTTVVNLHTMIAVHVLLCTVL